MSGSRDKLFYGYLNVISSVFVSFRDLQIWRFLISLLRNHCDRSFSSCLTTDLIVASFLAGNRRLVSSAK